jgi:hypothetical protein
MVAKHAKQVLAYRVKTVQCAFASCCLKAHSSGLNSLRAGAFWEGKYQIAISSFAGNSAFLQRTTRTPSGATILRAAAVWYSCHCPR